MSCRDFSIAAWLIESRERETTLSSPEGKFVAFFSHRAPAQAAWFGHPSPFSSSAGVGGHVLWPAALLCFFSLVPVFELQTEQNILKSDQNSFC